MRRGQITIFAVLGLVMLITVTLIVYVATQNTEETLSRTQEDLIANVEDDQRVETYLQTCIANAVEQTQRDFFLQGGHLYTSQGGLRDLGTLGEDYQQYTYQGETYNVTYGITNTTLCDDVTMDIPQYPEPRTNLSNLSDTYQTYISCVYSRGLERDSGHFGTNMFPKLCYNGSTNDGYFEGTAVCNGISYTENQSLETILQGGINQSIQDCTNGSTLRSDEGYNITLVNQTDVALIFSEDTYTADVTFPVRIISPQGTTAFTNLKYQHRAAGNPLKLAKFLFDMMTEETRNPAFSPGSSSILSTHYPGLNITLENVSGDRVVHVSDESVLAEDEHLTALNVFQNRNPALQFYDDATGRDYANVIISAGSQYTFEPRAIDPDDFQVLYNYQGFGQTYTGQWNPSCPDPDTEAGIKTCSSKVGISPPNTELKQSAAFQTTFRNASYRPPTTSAGLYYTQIVAEDHSGNVDYQNVSVLVLDPPNMTVSFGAPTDSSVISVEDPIRISATGSTPSAIGGGTWVNATYQLDDGSGFSHEKNKTPPNLLVYDYSSDIGANATNILTKQNSLTVGSTLDATVILRASAGAPGITSSSKPIMECTENSVSTPTYPFGGSTATWWNTKHSCCNASNIQGSSETCFQESADNVDKDEARDALDAIRTNALRTFSLSELTDLTDKIAVLDGMPLGQKVNYTVTSRCGGSRGNICTEPPDVTLDTP